MQRIFDLFSNYFNIVYRYVTAPDGLFVSVSLKYPLFLFCFVEFEFYFHQISGDKIETKIVGICLAIVAVLLGYLIWRSQKARCE